MRRGAVMVGALCLAQFVDVLGVTVVVTALPVMLADLGAPPSPRRAPRPARAVSSSAGS